VIIAENQADYAMWWINQIREGRVTAAAPTEVAAKDYNELLRAPELGDFDVRIA
jgi:hypothetical protein